MDINEKKKAAQKLINSFLKDNKLIDKPNVKIGFYSDDETIGVIERQATGVHPFDIITNGGYVKGHVNMVVGEEGIGKTFLFIKSMAYAQDKFQPFLDAYLNNEKSFDRKWAKVNGIVDGVPLLIGEFETTEESADFCLKCTEPEYGVDRLFVDTLQALAPEGELRKGNADKSVADNTMGLIPRVYSQFLRMYTSRSVGTLTLVLGSQVRVDLTTYGAPVKGTGGNALKHYNLLNVEMKRAGKAEWPTTEIPPNSFPVRFRLEKAKIPNRYKGCTLIGYFYKGSFDRKFNIVAIAKDLGLHDNKYLKYKVMAPSLDEAFGGDKDGMIEKEFTARGFNDFFNRIPDEAVDWLETQLMDAYTKKVMEEQPSTEEKDNATSLD